MAGIIASNVASRVPSSPGTPATVVGPAPASAPQQNAASAPAAAPAAAAQSAAVLIAAPLMAQVLASQSLKNALSENHDVDESADEQAPGAAAHAPLNDPIATASKHHDSAGSDSQKGTSWFDGDGGLTDDEVADLLAIRWAQLMRGIGEGGVGIRGYLQDEFGLVDAVFPIWDDAQADLFAND